MRACAAFFINGRFLTQRPTGVQRYALNVVRAIDQQFKGSADAPVVIAPSAAVDPGLSNLSLVRKGPFTGHAWEQFTLPNHAQGLLLNLGNTAPAFREAQVVCIHDVNSFVSPESYTRAFRAFYAALQPQLAKRSARIATVSQASARMLARHVPIPAVEIAVLPNGHEHALLWSPDDANIAPSMLAGRTRTDRPYVLAFGSRARHKNIQLLIDIADDLDVKNIDVVIAGGNLGIFAGAALQAKSNVYAAGHVTDADIAYFIDGALCLAFPSWTEGFGLPIVEAMARGCPVIASNCSSMPEIAGEAALLASPSEPAAWVAHIDALLLSKDLRTEMIERGRDQVKNFSWSRTAKDYIDLLANPVGWRSPSLGARASLPRISVVIATRGRPELVNATVRHLLSTQTMQPEALLVSCVNASDAGCLAEIARVEILTGPGGLAAQRNTALAALPEKTDIVVFFDDDFIAEPQWLAKAATIFRDEAGVVGLTGHVVADGILGPGIGFEDALALLSKAEAAEWRWKEPFSPYGCNMAFRVSALKEMRFDERLVLYGWLEDRDFAAALAKLGGRFVKSAEIKGVHMGVKSGRVRGERLGYSQVINPLYMLRKRTMTPGQVAGQIVRNLISNFGRALWPEPFIDRRGRMRGNLIAFADLLHGRLQPERAALLDLAVKPDFSKPKLNAP